MSARTRTTISLPVETLEVFKCMSEITGVSVSRCIGDWLADTQDAAVLANQKVLEQRALPKKFLASLQALNDDSGIEVSRGETCKDFAVGTLDPFKHFY